VIDWKRRGLQLAEVVNRHQKERMLNDRNLGWELAAEMLRLGKIEDQAKKKFLQYWKCKDKKKRERLFNEYLEISRQVDQGESI
jgi:hypothetical protein